MGNNPDPPTEPELPPAVPGKKRVFTEDFRRRCVAYYDSLPKDGSKGAYLRRCGVFSSQITDWRRSSQSTPAVSKPGRKPTDAVVVENAQLQAKVAKLERELERANTVIEVQKKVTSLLEMHLEPKGDES